MDLLLTAWREVSRNENIVSVCRKLGTLLRNELHQHALVLARFDLDHSKIVLLAVDNSPGTEPLSFLDIDGDTECYESLIQWAARRETSVVTFGETHPVNCLLPEQGWSNVVVGPLLDESGVLGLAMLVGVDDSVQLPAARIRLEHLLEPLAVALQNDLRLHELQRLRDAVEAENQALLKKLGRQDITDAVIGAESGLKEVIGRVAQVGPTDVHVLLLGETGTGKEVVARLIHTGSSRAEGPMLRVNCGGIPSGVIDSELFGHERGSFTGAHEQHRGWFERADGGTLFLDEIGELPPDAQVRLLRVLQDGVIQRVGGTSVVHVDVRIVAATHRDLWTMVAEGTFREDLWYRLSIFPIHLPPLRDRKHDIPALATHFASRAGFRHGGSPLNLSDKDIELLMEYDWPGNVRELNAVIERAAILGNGRTLHVAKAIGIQESGSGRQGGVENRSGVGGEVKGIVNRKFVSFEEGTKRHIEEALEITHGVVEGPRGAASILKLNPHTLRSKMRKLGIDWKHYRELGDIF